MGFFRGCGIYISFGELKRTPYANFSVNKMKNKITCPFFFKDFLNKKEITGGGFFFFTGKTK